MDEKNVSEIAKIGKRQLVLYSLLGVMGLIGACRHGPIDFTRTVYNAMTGDTPVLHKSLEESCYQNILFYQVTKSDQDVESNTQHSLASVLNVNYVFDNSFSSARANTASASLEDLWDCVDTHARNSFEKYVWTRLRK